MYTLGIVATKTTSIGCSRISIDILMHEVMIILQMIMPWAFQTDYFTDWCIRLLVLHSLSASRMIQKPHRQLLRLLIPWRCLIFFFHCCIFFFVCYTNKESSNSEISIYPLSVFWNKVYFSRNHSNITYLLWVFTFQNTNYREIPLTSTKHCHRWNNIKNMTFVHNVSSP